MAEISRKEIHFLTMRGYMSSVPARPKKTVQQANGKEKYWN